MRYTVHSTGIKDFLRLTLSEKTPLLLYTSGLCWKYYSSPLKTVFCTSCDGIPFIWEITETSVTPVYQGQGRIESCLEPCPKCMDNAVNALVLYVFICRYIFKCFLSFSLLLPYDPLQLDLFRTHYPPIPIPIQLDHILGMVGRQKMYLPCSIKITKSLIVNSYLQFG